MMALGRTVYTTKLSFYDYFVLQLESGTEWLNLPSKLVEQIAKAADEKKSTPLRKALLKACGLV